MNGDSEFNTADLVTLQKWLLGKPDTVLKNWKSADFCNDNGTVSVTALSVLEEEIDLFERVATQIINRFSIK